MNSMTPFEQSAPRGASQATMVEQSRAVAEVQAAVIVAMRNPRVVDMAMQEMRQVCGITELAERAFFRFGRGGQQVTGESVHLARELARIWGNVVFGLTELSRDDHRGQSEMQAYAWDLQTNARSQTTFIVPHSRDTKNGAKALTDMRDIYENNANMGARRLREMIFAVLPVWFREEAASICRHTLEHGGGKPLVQRIADCVQGYASIGITRAQLERRMGRKVDALTAEDVASLGVMFKSIKRGEVQRDDEFPRDVLEAPAGGGDALEQASAGKAPPPAEPKAEAPPPEPEKPAPAPVSPLDDLSPKVRSSLDGLLRDIEACPTIADLDERVMKAEAGLAQLPEAAARHVRRLIGDRRVALAEAA
ncbi:hypothetical protein [Rhodovarius lipocyclicus]|uniref:hypothetical protein n=1 Tax=Rhodovarius lipocyclicus TaxID=268410 RepID=UPI0019170486|nr:hypothetical protein [Rhodovarius lipocyclicus]